MTLDNSLILAYTVEINLDFPNDEHSVITVYCLMNQNWTTQDTD